MAFNWSTSSKARILESILIAMRVLFRYLDSISSN
jgi:hypothetical protein